VGAPRLTLSYSGSSPAGVRPTRVFAQLVDDATGIVLGNQVTPIQVTLDGKPHQTSVALEDIAYTAHAGTHVTLQMVATTTAYAQPRLGGSVTFDSIAVSLPVAAGLQAR
jgi:ABC-2 type transport system ATP-binding protein